MVELILSHNKEAENYFFIALFLIQIWYKNFREVHLKMSEINKGEVSSGWVSETVIKKMLEMLEKTQFGSITLIIQDGVVSQIERKEKLRLI